MADIIALSGSPTPTSRSTALLSHVQAQLEAKGLTTDWISVLDLPPEDLVSGNFESPILKSIQERVDQANAIVVCAPIYKANYPGVLKALLDLLPQYAFAGKLILPMATAGTLAHLLAIDYAVKPLFGIMGATQILRGVYSLSAQIQFEADSSLKLDPDIEDRLVTSIQEIVTYLKPGT